MELFQLVEGFNRLLAALFTIFYFYQLDVYKRQLCLRAVGNG